MTYAPSPVSPGSSRSPSALRLASANSPSPLPSSPNSSPGCTGDELAQLGSLLLQLEDAIYSSTGPDILLAAFVAEDAADYLREDELAPAGSLSRATTVRWIRDLAERGLIERLDGSIALTSAGYDAVSVLIQRVSAAQRRLDPPKD